MFLLGVPPCPKLGGRGWGEDEFYVFFFAVDFKGSRFKCLCLVAADAAWYAMELAILFKEFYCSLGVAVRMYDC